MLDFRRPSRYQQLIRCTARGRSFLRAYAASLTKNSTQSGKWSEILQERAVFDSPPWSSGTKSKLPALTKSSVSTERVLSSKPGDLVVEMPVLRVVEDCARNLIQRVGRRQPSRGQRLPQRIAAAVDIEVPQSEQVFAPLLLTFRPVCKPRGYLFQFVDAIRRRLPVKDVQGDKREPRVPVSKLTA